MMLKINKNHIHRKYHDASNLMVEVVIQPLKRFIERNLILEKCVEKIFPRLNIKNQYAFVFNISTIRHINQLNVVIQFDCKV